MPNSAPPVLPSSPPPRKRPWRRRFIILGGLVVALGLFVAILPRLLSLSAFKPRVERILSENLGVPVTLRGYRLGWTRGATIDGLSVAQPPGFPGDRPMLTLEHAGLAISWLGLLGGDFDIAGEVRGLRVLVYQKKDGSVNFEQLAGGPRATRRDGEPDGDTRIDIKANTTLQRLRADLALRDIEIDIVHEEQGVMESIRRLEGTVDKRLGGTDFKIQVSAELAGPDASKPPGKLQVDADVDGTMQRPLDVQVTSAGFDFARYRPLVDALLEQGSLSALDGVLDGTVKVRIENLDTVFVTGALTVTGPHFAGALLQGMNVQASRWVINPDVKFATAKAGAPAHADISGLSIDLGFARLRGVAPAAAATAFAGSPTLTGRQTLGIDFEVDLQALGQFGGPIPALLRAQPGKLEGRAFLAIPVDGFASVDVMKLITEALVLDAKIEVPTLALGADTALGALALQTSLVGGAVKATLAPGGSLNGGALSLDAGMDLTKSSWPTTVTLGVTDGQLAGGAVHLLQYAVPLFAGLAGQQHVQLDGKGTLAMQFGGPAAMVADESWLQWLNRWAGTGKVALAQGSVVPAPAFAGLLQWLDPDGGGKFAFDSIATDFVLRQGSVDTGLLELDGKAKKIQISGRTNLDGTLDHRFDMLGLLAGHKDGDKVLAYLKGRALGASIVGTLASPRVALPDMQQVLTEALEAAAKDELKKQADDLLKKGLEGLFRRKGK